MGRIRIGCSGWNYASWRGDFYPPGCPPSRWLEHYATKFDTVEINATFYRLPNRDAVARWVEQVPEGFVFAVKSSRYLTHIKRLSDMDQGLERLFVERLEAMTTSPKMGPVLWQLPATFRRDDERLAFALERLPPGMRHVFEFRHESWFHADVEKLLSEHNVALVRAHRKGVPDPPPWHTADFSFLRFHHGDRGRRGNYSDTELREWADRVRQLAGHGDVYAYFNNDWEIFAPRNAVRLKRLLG